VSDEEDKPDPVHTAEEMAILAETYQVITAAVEQMQETKFDLVAQQIAAVLATFRDAATAAGFSVEFAEKLAMQWALSNLLEQEIKLHVTYEHEVNVEDGDEEED